MRDFALGLIGLVSAYLYLLGYLYLTGFYGHFDIMMNELEFGIKDIVAHSFAVIKSSSDYLQAAFVIIVILYLVFHFNGTPNSRQATLTNWLAGLAIGGVMFFLSLEASVIGTTAAKTTIRSFRHVEVYSNFSKDPPIESLLGTDEPDLRLIAATKQTIFILHQFPGVGQQWVVRLARDRYFATLTFRDSQRAP